MAIARFLDGMCLALRASGLWLRYATLQNLIPSFPWIAPHALHPGAIQGKEGIKFCNLATLQVRGRHGARAGHEPQPGPGARAGDEEDQVLRPPLPLRLLLSPTEEKRRLRHRRRRADAHFRKDLEPFHVE